MRGILLAVACIVVSTAVTPRDVTAVDTQFSTEIVLDGLTLPTNVEFAPDGRIFVAEKSGIVRVFDDLADNTPDVFVDLRDQVHNYKDRGLLALELHPDWGVTPYVYVGLSYDGPVGSTAPVWGTVGATFDDCPNNPPGQVNGECLGSTQVLRYDATTNVGADETLILWDYCEPNRSHSIGDLQFAPDGSLYVSHGEAAWAHGANYGQPGGSRPANTCGDPNTPMGTAPTLPEAEGGMLRSQDLRTLSDPVGMEGTVIRIDAATAAGLADNPFGTHADLNARRIVAYGLRNPFRFTMRPGTDDTYVADVGWHGYEEINRIQNPPARVDASDPDAANADNFGWPCYEGPARQSAFDSLNLTICEDL
ncbi:MAG: PQQ-dependent sugar dehydrogenase, partial [Actinomycetota bacterium]|nr:PQQ-dependent sugar dehydrogenase [Actinomycetota bacterium]